MIAEAEPNASIPPELWASGWHQGILFHLTGAIYFWNGPPESDASGPSVRQRVNKEKELLVLISQDCDILSRDEPRVEALLVRVKDRPKDQSYLARIANNSYREFVLDMDAGLVADARVRIQIAKEALGEAQIEPWTMDDPTREDFVDWLAGRYDRPPVPAEVHEAISRPLRQLFEGLAASEPDRFAALNRSVKKIRIRLPEYISSPLDVGLLLILADEIDEEGAAAVEAVEPDIQRVVAASGISCDLKIESRLYGQVLLSEHDATRPLDLDYMTSNGDETG